MDLHKQAHSGAEILHLLRNAPESKGGLWIACEWLFAENCWRRLQGEIRDSFVSESERLCISYTKHADGQSSV